VASRSELAALLEKGSQALGVALDGQQCKQLLDYVALLAKWNTVYNLTAIRDPQQMLIQHLLDSLSVVPHLCVHAHEHMAVLDVGSGGGLPGIVLAIVRPGWQVTLNDIVQKKTAFQLQVKAELGLANLAVVTGRVESLRAGVDVPSKFDAIISRAFAKLADFVTLSRHLLADQGTIWAMKGVRPDDELAHLPPCAQVTRIIRLNVPMLQAERHLVEIGIMPNAQNTASTAES
jgi:16S rRNA (guanine527-N7)-methyltransferase